MNKHKLEKANYTGYLWYSDAKEPKLYYLTEKEFEFDDSTNPFVVEGWLIDKDKELSYSIQYINGEYVIRKYNINDLEHIESTEKIYIPSFKGFKEIVFNQYWRPQKDELCENMEVLVPAEFVFIDLIK